MDYNFFIVALGASAGGLEAIRDFFSVTKERADVAYVVILHSSRECESALVSILSRITTIPVVEIAQGTIVERNKIYIHPPAVKVSLKDGFFILTKRSTFEVINYTINHFFTSLAQDAKSRSIAIVMSGTGSDGTKGLHAVDEQKGITIVQHPDTATFNGMPNNSIKFDNPTYVLAPKEMPLVIEHIVTTAINGLQSS